MNTDLIIIGAGPGGYRAAAYAASQGLQVVLFEKDRVGGTCLNVGCIPTKTYVHAATFREARERMAEVVAGLRAGVESILTHPNVTLVRETACFTDAHTVCSESGDSFTASNIIIATGSETKWLPIKGMDDPRVVDSTGLLQLDTQPQRLAIIGAGVIGMEFASVFHRFGSEVTVIEYLKECLPALDADIAKRLRKALERQQTGDGTGMKKGITFKMKTAVENIADIDADVILMATGRRPCTEGLNLEAAGVTLTPQGAIPVDDDFKVDGNQSLYAIGDVNGRQMLAHAAEMQGIHAINQIVGKADNIRFDIMPAAIFTEPEAACVGPTEDQLKAAVVSGSLPGGSYTCRKAFWRSNGKATAMGETEGMLKLFAGHDGRILGCHAYGAHAADIVQEVSVLICRETTLEQLRDMIHIHPTLSEILLSAVQ